MLTSAPTHLDNELFTLMSCQLYTIFLLFSKIQNILQQTVEK